MHTSVSIDLYSLKVVTNSLSKFCDVATCFVCVCKGTEKGFV